MDELLVQQSDRRGLVGWHRVGSTVAPLLLMVALTAYCLLAVQTARHIDKDWSHLWLGGRMVVAGEASRLYDPQRQVEVYRQADPNGQPPAVWEERNRMFGCFNYPPPAALGYAALAWLPMGTAAVVHAYLNIVMAVVCAGLLASSLGRPRSWLPVTVALLAYPAFFINLSLGQNAVFTMTVVLAGWCLCERRREITAGLVLGLLVCKPNWLFAIGWIPLVHGRWRVLLGIAFGGTAVVGLTALILGVQPYWDYYDVFRRVASLHYMPGYYLDVKYSALGMFRKWFGMSRSADLLGWASCIVVVLATWRATRGCWRPGTPAFGRALGCCLMACLWVNPHLNYYDLLLTAPCAAALLMDWPNSDRRGRIIALAVVVFAYIAIPWDESWSWRRTFPLPSFAILAMWGWFARRLAVDRAVPAGREASRSAPLAVPQAGA